jgi:hypothetical protein
MSMAKTIQPRSDQMNNADLLAGDRILTITKVEVRDEADEQPVSIWFAEFPQGRPFKPSLTVRRILVAAWGDDENTYVGRRLHLYRDETVTFGKDKPGGIRIKAMSHIKARFAVTLAVSRGKVAPYVIDVLPDDAPATPAVSAETLAELTATFERKGIAENARLSGANSLTGGSATDIETLTEAEARTVLAALEKRPDVDPGDIPTPEPGASDE